MNCWLWKGYTMSNGYGRGGLTTAHRYVYEALVGPIPEGLELDHLCGKRSCVNPEHLEPVTPRTNNMRSNSVAAKNARKTHCIRGHSEWVASRTRKVGGKPLRYCRPCHNARLRRLWPDSPYRKRRMGKDA